MANRTYRYFKGEPLFPFGYGLSYTTFKYSNLKIDKKFNGGDTVKISVRVKNSGKVAGDEVVQVYVSNLDASVPVPLRALKGFKRIHLLPGEARIVSFSISPEAFSVIDDKNKRVIIPGRFELTVGGGQPKEKPGVKETGILRASINIL
jgi:beta-glucosidase